MRPPKDNKTEMRLLMKNAYYLGIDVGSTASKVAIVNAAGDLVGKGLHSSGAGTPGPQKALDAALAEAGIALEDVTYSCSTGYGRHLLEWTNAQMSELSCHAKGAAALFDDVHTVIDIGGQDAKVLHLGKDGALDQFVMNDKCAAGTGRFLDVMASIFGCAVSDLSDYDKQATSIAHISSTCTVFAESEVISKLAAGESIPDIVAGIHSSVVDRTFGLAKRLGIKPNVAMTGGVALNEGLRARLEERIGQPIQTSPLSQMNGALGAALYALERCPEEKI